MKKILLLTSAVILFATSGCLVRDGRGYHGERHEEHPAVVVEHPDIVVRPPEVIVR